MLQELSRRGKVPILPPRPVPIVNASTARHLFLGAQGLLDDPTRRATPAGIRKLVQKLGYVQMDSINVIERAHHLILASRLRRCGRSESRSTSAGPRL